MRMRRYFKKSDQDGNPVASKEAMKLWKTDEGRAWFYHARSMRN